MVDSDASGDEYSTKTDEEAVFYENIEYVGVGDPVHSPVPVGSKQAGPARRASCRGSKKTAKMLAYEKSLKKNQDSPDFLPQDDIQENSANRNNDTELVDSPDKMDLIPVSASADGDPEQGNGSSLTDEEVFSTCISVSVPESEQVHSNTENPVAEETESDRENSSTVSQISANKDTQIDDEAVFENPSQEDTKEAECSAALLPTMDVMGNRESNVSDGSEIVSACALRESAVTKVVMNLHEQSENNVENFLKLVIQLVQDMEKNIYPEGYGTQ